MAVEKLQMIPFYTGDQTLEAALMNPKSVRLLWLEILLNSHFQWERSFDRPEIKTAYDKACVWYARYRTMVESHGFEVILSANRPI
jgi:hypothetical protein